MVIKIYLHRILYNFVFILVLFFLYSNSYLLAQDKQYQKALEQNIDVKKLEKAYKRARRIDGIDCRPVRSKPEFDGTLVPREVFPRPACRLPAAFEL